MAVINAANDGLWSVATTWPSSVFPTSADDVYANNKTVYINQNITVLSLNTTQGTGGVAGGRFYQNSNTRVNASIYAGSTIALTVTGQNCILSGAMFKGSDTSSSQGVYIQGNLAPFAPPSLTSYGVLSGGVGGGAAGTLEAGSLVHYGAIIAGTANNSNGLTLGNSYASPSAVNLVVYNGPVLGGQNGTSSNLRGIIINFNPSGPGLTNSSITINAPVSGGNGTNVTNAAGVELQTNIPVIVNGNVYGGDGPQFSNAGVAITTASAAAYIFGNVYSSAQGGGAGLWLNNATASAYVVGNVYALDGGTNTSQGIYNSGSTSFVSITGNLFGASGLGFNASGWALYQTGASATCTVYGNISGGSTPAAHGVLHNSNFNRLTVFGNVSGGSGSNSYGVLNTSTGTVIVSGAAVGGNAVFTYGVYNRDAGGTAIIKRIRGNAYGNESMGDPALPTLSLNYGLFTGSISCNNFCEELEFGPRGAVPTNAHVLFLNTGTNQARVITTSKAVKTLVTNTATDVLPPASSVVAGVTYNSSLCTGTMSVPPASAVAFGVPVSVTSGTAVLTPSLIWQTANNTLTATSLSGTLGYKLANVATTQVIGQQVAAYNT